jgi:hypothetical protein
MREGSTALLISVLLCGTPDKGKIPNEACTMQYHKSTVALPTSLSLGNGEEVHVSKHQP